MADQVVRLEVEDFDDTMAMMARAFAEHGGHDFPRMYPALYRPTAEVMRRHLAVRRDGRVAAALGIMPIDFRVGGVPLRVAGIAGVATDPPCRGEGMMNLIMEAAVASIRCDGYELSYLGGHRQRYGRYGWEVTGTSTKMSFDAKNMAAVDVEGVCFAPLPDKGADLATAHRWHDARAAYCQRSQDSFHPMLCNWEQVPQAAYDVSGRMMGYLSADKAGATITELVGADAASAERLLAAWVRQQTGTVTLWLDRYECDLTRRLGRFAQHTTIDTAGNWQIFDWQQTLDALWRVRCRQAPMPAGSIVLGVEGVSGNLSMAVEDGNAVCKKSDQPADLSTDAATMMRILFGPVEPATVISLAGRAEILHAWCPLPLALPGPDRV